MRVPREEALRYLHAAGAEGPVAAMTEEMAALLERSVRPGTAYRRFALRKTGCGAEMEEAGVVLPGTLAGKMLEDCREAVLLVCTLGAGFDALMRTWQRRDMARAVVLDACGSALTEAVCDAAEEEMKQRWPGMYLTDRFSPGYGDLPLSLQGDVLRALRAEKSPGVTVNDSGMMVPQKSVTAVIGLADRLQMRRIRGCGGCGMAETCEYRKRGTTCAV